VSPALNTRRPIAVVGHVGDAVGDGPGHRAIIKAAANTAVRRVAGRQHLAGYSAVTGAWATLSRPWQEPARPCSSARMSPWFSPALNTLQGVQRADRHVGDALGHRAGHRRRRQGDGNTASSSRQRQYAPGLQRDQRNVVTIVRTVQDTGSTVLVGTNVAMSSRRPSNTLQAFSALTSTWSTLSAPCRTPARLMERLQRRDGVSPASTPCRAFSAQRARGPRCRRRAGHGAAALVGKVAGMDN